MSNIKSKEERVKESITILNKIKGLGINPTDPGFRDLSIQFSDWVKGEESWTGEIEFCRHQRTAKVHLPIEKGKTATCNLIVWKEVRDSINNMT